MRPLKSLQIEQDDRPAAARVSGTLAPDDSIDVRCAGTSRGRTRIDPEHLGLSEITEAEVLNPQPHVSVKVDEEGLHLIYALDYDENAVVHPVVRVSGKAGAPVALKPMAKADRLVAEPAPVARLI